MNIEEMASCGGGKNRGEVRIHDSLDELATDLADYVSQVSEASVRERGHFAVALSGGSLIGLMGKICQAPYTRIVDWAKWHIFWADERVVAKSHADSNYKLAKEGLISKVPVVPCHIYAINDSLPADAAARDYEFSLRQLVKTRTVDVSEICDCPKFDLILLGMGSDGHVASLFPDHPALDVKDEWVTYLIDSPKPPPERITFTLPVINSASNVAVVATGSENAEAVHLAIDDNVPTEHMSPARMVCPSDGKLVWFLEMSAASQLKARKGVSRA